MMEDFCEKCGKKPRRRGCGKFCLDCYIDDKRERNLARAQSPEGKCTACGDVLSPLAKKGKCTRCLKKEDQERWLKRERRLGLEIKEGEQQKKKARCSYCARTAEEHKSRLYGGKCAECRGADRPQRRSKKAHSTLGGEGRGEGAEAPETLMGGGKRESKLSISDHADGTTIVGKIMIQFNEALAKARACREALIVIKNLTAAEIEIPEIEA